jgi:hypothetical protein
MEIATSADVTPRWDSVLIDTWLILPAVICLFQRLSHACLRISLKMVNLRTAHYNSHSLLDLDILLG